MRAVTGLQTALTRHLDQLVDGLAELQQVKPLGALDVGHHQAAGSGGRDAEVHVAVVDDLLAFLVPGGVQVGVAAQRQADGLRVDQQRRDAQAGELPPRLEGLDELHGAGHVDGDPFGHVHVVAHRAHHVLGRHLADALDRHPPLRAALQGIEAAEPLRRPEAAAEARAAERGAPERGPRLRCARLTGRLEGGVVVEDAALPRLLIEVAEGGGRLDVAPRDGAVGAGSDHGGQVDAEVLGVLAHGRLGPGVG